MGRNAPFFWWDFGGILVGFWWDMLAPSMGQGRV